MIRYTDVFLAGGRDLTTPLRAEIAALFDASQLVELTAGIALFMGFSKIAIALGQAPDDMPRMEVPTPDWTAA